MYYEGATSITPKYHPHKLFRSPEPFIHFLPFEITRRKTQNMENQMVKNMENEMEIGPQP